MIPRSKSPEETKIMDIPFVSSRNILSCKKKVTLALLFFIKKSLYYLRAILSFRFKEESKAPE